MAPALSLPSDTHRDPFGLVRVERVGIPLDPAVATCRHQPTNWTLAPRELHAGEGLVLREVGRLTKEVHQRVCPQWGSRLGFSNLPR